MSRRSRAGLILTACLVGVALCLSRCVVTVDETQFVIVTSFGRTVAIHGDQPGETGLHLRWPWQSVTPIDRRLQISDQPGRELMTADKKNLEVASFVVWRVAQPQRYLEAAGSLDVAAARVDERLAALLGQALGRRPLETLATTEPGSDQIAALEIEVRDALRPPALDELGVEVLDFRLRRFNFPVEVRPAVFDLIRSERKQVAATLRAEGAAQYQTLTSQADRDRDVVLATAEAEAERILGQAEAEAIHILNDAHGRDPRFYEFRRTLEAYRALLDDRSTLVLSASSPLLKLLVDGPPPEREEAARPGPAEPQP